MTVVESAVRGKRPGEMNSGLTVIRPCTEADYLRAFWTHQVAKGGWTPPPPPRERRKEILLNRWPHKFPYEGTREVTWWICAVSTLQELEQLHMKKIGDWLETHNLWRGSNRLGDLAKTGLETEFFTNPANRETGQWKNYYRWRDADLRGRLDENERPTLLDEEGQVSILDGWGRLFAYLALIYEGKEFFPFEAVLVRPVTFNER